MNIQEIMSTPPVTCGVYDNLNTAAKLMWENDCGSLPVISSDGDIVGMVTDRDICMATYTRGHAPQEIPVSEAMAKEVFSCHADDSLDTAERLMSEKQVRRIPIVDAGGRPVGLLSLGDIARYAASARKKNGLEREVTQTLAAICQPRAPGKLSQKVTPKAPSQKQRQAAL